MADLSELAPWKRAPLLAFGAGLLAGGFEAIQIAVNLKLSLTFGEGVLLAATACLLGAALAVGMSVPAGLLAQLLTRRWLTYRRHALALALVAAGLGVWYLLPAAQTLLEQGRQEAALAFALTPVGIGGVIWFNALFWLRREYIDSAPRLGWWFWSAVGALLLCVVSGAWSSQRDRTRVAAIETDPDVVLITVDTLRRDHLSIYGEDPLGQGTPPVQTPALDALAREGILYRNAITPMPETLPAHTAMFTGLHPVRSKVLSNGHTLAQGYQTLAERLVDEGYATGAFVSSFAVDSRTGLDQGFQVYDDDFFPLVRGLSEIQAAHIGMKVIMRVLDPTDFPFLLERKAPTTIARALDWLAVNRDRPAFAWVHLFEPHAPYEPHGLPGFEDNGTPAQPALDHREILSNEADFVYTDAVRARLRRLYAEEVAYTDQQIGLLVERLRAQHNPVRPLLIIITADHGEMLGEHSYEFNHHGIYDEAVRVPLLILPAEFSEKTRVVDEQVRLMDIFATVLRQLRLEVPEKTESGELVKFAELPDQRGYSSLLMGRRTASLREGTLYGYRARNKEGGDIKYIWSPDEAREEVYDLQVDPREEDNIVARQLEVAGTLRARVQQELGASGISAESLLPEIDPATREALRAMGYVDD